MKGKINTNIDIPESSNTRLTTGDIIISKITETIGRGEDARNSFVYLTIKWSFIAGCIITVLIVVNHWLFRMNETIPDFTHDIQLVWDIVVPMITLALGYAFGKSRD